MAQEIENPMLELPESHQRLLVAHAKRKKTTIMDLLRRRSVNDVLRQEAMHGLDKIITRGGEVPAELVAESEGN